MLDTWHLLKNTNFPAIKRSALEILQVNLGYLCNQTCLHCHVNAGPNRKELMTEENIEHLLNILALPEVHTLDLTGGAPEMNPLFRELVVAARKQNVKVIDRCNLTILLEPDQTGLAQFLADNQVEIVASLPCYLQENVDGQRGKGVYKKSIEALKILNNLGYASADSSLILNLVYNPLGPYLPPAQETLQQDYKKYLEEEYDIHFNQLFTITNMPIARFGSTLLSKGQFKEYMDLLKGSFNPCSMDGLMCKNQLSVDWQGYIYDCDFNQMLELKMKNENTHEPLHIRDVLQLSLADQPILVADHCYGCTAGQGSSCGGAIN